MLRLPVTFLIAALVATPAHAADTHTFEAGITHARLEVPAGDVRVQQGGDQLVVTLSPNARCVARVGGVDGDAVVEVSGRRCEVDLVVSLPAGGSVELELGAGDVVVEDVDGPVTLEVGAGDVRLEDVGSARVEIGAGELRGTARQLDAEVAAGAVRVAGLEQPSRISVAVGHVEVDLPDGADPALVEAEADLGGVTFR